MRGFFASILASIARLRALAPVRADRKASAAHAAVQSRGLPFDAARKATAPNEREKIVWLNITSVP